MWQVGSVTHCKHCPSMVPWSEVQVLKKASSLRSLELPRPSQECQAALRGSSEPLGSSVTSRVSQSGQVVLSGPVESHPYVKCVTEPRQSLFTVASLTQYKGRLVTSLS